MKNNTGRGKQKKIVTSNDRLKPSIPLHFDSTHYEDHLEISKNGSLIEIRYPLLDLAIYQRSRKAPFGDMPNINSIRKNTPGFKIYNRFGFSLFNYHEFFVGFDWVPNVPIARFSIKGADVSLGTATPLAMFIFWNEHDDDYHGDWDIINTIRVIGPNDDEIEKLLLNILLFIQKETGLEISIKEIKPYDWGEQDEDENSKYNLLKLKNKLKIFEDYEPTWLYFVALSENDASSACIKLYRVLEYYSFKDKYADIRKLASDKSIDAPTFMLSIKRVLYPNERQNMCAFIEKVVTDTITRKAKKLKLIESPEPRHFASALYNFRTSIVHAKYEHHANIMVDSLLSPDELLDNWLTILKDLSYRVLCLFGRR